MENRILNLTILKEGDYIHSEWNGGSCEGKVIEFINNWIDPKNNSGNSRYYPNPQDVIKCSVIITNNGVEIPETNDNMLMGADKDTCHIRRMTDEEIQAFDTRYNEFIEKFNELKK